MKPDKNSLIITVAALSSSLALSSALALSGCLAVAAGAGGEAAYIATQDDRTAGETLSDQSIVTGIKARYVANKNVSALDIGVSSFKGVVTLRANVRSQVEADTAIDIAKHVEGVKDVISKIHVEP